MFVYVKVKVVEGGRREGAGFREREGEGEDGGRWKARGGRFSNSEFEMRKWGFAPLTPPPR